MHRISVPIVIAMTGLLSGQAQAKTTLQIEVREMKKSRLVSADVYIRTSQRKLVRKLLAAGGRARLDNAPAGTLELEARTRTGGLFGLTSVVVKAGQLARAVIRVAPFKVQAGTVKASPQPTAKVAVSGGSTVQAAAPKGTVTKFTATKGTTPKMATPQVATPQVATPKTATPQVGTTKVAGLMLRDLGKGKHRVCRGDVFDAKGRRVSGRITIFRGKPAVGFAVVSGGLFSLFDLAPGTYRLEFTSHDKKLRATSTTVIASNKLSKVVLRAK